MKSIHVLESSLVVGIVAVAAFAACQGTIGDPTGASSGTSGTTGTTSTIGPPVYYADGAVAPPGATTGATVYYADGAVAPSPPVTTYYADGAVAPPPVGPAGSLPPATGAALTPESSGQLLMRRLTNTEYNNIVAHLLGDTTQPGAAFATDPTTPNGYVAPTSVAEQNVLQYYQTALALANTALTSPTAAGNQLVVPTGSGTAGATSFINQFGLVAYRRPVAAAELSDLLTIVFQPAIAAGTTFKAAIGYVAQAMLNSPNFLYHWEIGPTEPTPDPVTGLVPLTPWQLASRLSMTLWNDMPDATLLQAAQNNELSTPAQVSAQVARMYADPRASQALFDLHFQWLLQVAGNVTVLNQVAHSSPLWTTAAADSLQGEFTTFLSSAVYSPTTGDGTYKTLMTAPYAYINAALAPIYGVTAPTGTGFSQVQLDSTKRAGILTQSAFLSTQADTLDDNPVRRGLGVFENLLCGSVLPPPNVIPPLSTPAAAQTTRDLFVAHATVQPCVGCHAFFDPPGFAFENYDATGAYRTTDNGGAVSSLGSFTTPGGCVAGVSLTTGVTQYPCGTPITFQNAVDLVTQLSVLPEAQWCAERQWYRYASGRLETSAEQGSLQIAYRAGAATPGFSLRDSLTSLVTSQAFLYRTPSPGETL